MNSRRKFLTMFGLSVVAAPVMAKAAQAELATHVPVLHQLDAIDVPDHSHPVTYCDGAHTHTFTPGPHTHTGWNIPARQA